MDSRYVLLAEDNQVNQAVGRAMLESLGCMVDVASDGREVLKLLESASYDLILMDCQMPSMDGWEATRRIRENKNPKLARIPVIALTAHVKDGDREQCLAVGMDDYLSKPFRLYELSEIVDRWSDRGKTPDEEPGNSDDKESRGPLAAVSDTGADQIGSPASIDRIVLENIKSMFGAGGQNMLAQIIRIYISDSPALLDGMSKALRDRDSERMSKAAHALKSSSANLGAVVLAGLCRMVEDIARLGSTEGTESIFVPDPSGIREGKSGLGRRVREGDLMKEVVLGPEERLPALVIDDDRAARTLACALLEETGFLVEQASDGMEGLSAFERLRPSIVLLDVVMPRMDGFAVCKAIRRSRKGSTFQSS